MNAIIDGLIGRYPALAGAGESIRAMTGSIIEAYERGNKLFVAGNGGSCADAEHIAGELLKSFHIRRKLPESDRAELAKLFGGEGEKLAEKLEPAFPCVALHSHIGFLTAFWNDVGAEYAYAQQLSAQGRPGDVFIGITCSGNASNIRYAMMAARIKGVKTILLTGNGRGKCESVADLVVAAPASDPYLVQEYHLPIYHAMCLAVEDHFHGR